MGLSSESLTSYRSALRGLIEFAQESEGACADELLVAAYVTSMRDHWAVRTTNHRITVFTKFGEYFGKQFLSDYKKKRPAQGLNRSLPQGMSDVHRMVEYARKTENANLLAALALTGITALRVGEALKVTIDDLDIENMVVAVQGKGGHERIVPLPYAALALLEPALRRCEEDDDERLIRLSRSAICRAIKRAADIAADTEASSHDLRATKLTHMARQGVDVVTIQNIAGHADPRTTEIYIRSTMDDMRAAINV